MMQKLVVNTTAWLEIIVGVIFLTATDSPCRLLFAAKPEGVGIALARFAGVASWPGAPHIAYFAMCGFSAQLECVGITIKLRCSER
jgi:hypothetical protein